MIARLRNFHGTARRASGHPEAPSKEELRALDQWVLGLLNLHFATFALGIVALAVSLLLTYGGKLI